MEVGFLFGGEILKQIHYPTQLLTSAAFACKGFALIPALAAVFPCVN